MANTGTGSSGDFETITRRYWQAWSDALRTPAGMAAQPAAAPSWREALDWWSRLAPPQPSDVNRTLERFNTQAAEWFGAMQQLAVRFAGQGGSPAEVASAWRDVLGGDGGQWFHSVFASLRGPGQPGIDAWLEQAMRHLQAWQRDSAAWTQSPTFGPAREHQARWQALVAAQQDYQQRLQAYTQLMRRSFDLSFDLFERKLTEHEAPGQQLTSARALFDLWIDAAEEAYAGIAMSDEFQRIYAALGNAQMRLRAALQREVEQLCGLLGMPGRTEVDAAHRKIVELERAVRRLEAALADKSQGSANDAADATRATAKPKPKPKPKPQPAAANKGAGSASVKASTRKRQ